MGKIKILAMVGGLIALSTTVLIGWILFGNRVDSTEQLQLGLRLARKGDYATAAKLAQSLNPDQFAKRSDMTTVHFLVGAAARQTAEILQHRPSRTLKNEEAVIELQKSRDMKFPAGYEGVGNYMLGMALYELFRWEEAIEPLTIASDRWPKGRNDAVERLIDIDLYGEHPDPDAATQRLERWAALSALTPNDVDRITVKRMEILGTQGDHVQMQPLWQSIVPESPMRSHANLILARCLREDAHEKDPPSAPSDRRQQAMSHLKEIDTLRNVPTDIRRRSMFEQGLLYRDSGDTRQAVSAMSSLRLSSPFEPEFMMAGIEEIDALIDLNQYSETIATLEQLTRNFKDPKWFDNCWMPISQMRTRLLASANRLADREVFEQAERFVANLPNLCTEVDRLRLDAVIHDRWGRRLQHEWRNKPTYNSPELAVESQGSDLIEKTFRRAAQSIERLCLLDMRAPNYMELLWIGIEDYHFSNDFVGSNRLIERFLDLAPRSDHARPLLMRAKNFAAAGQSEEALKTIDKLLLMTPDSPLVPDAKLTAAKLHWNLGDFEKAESLIVENLYSGNLKPDSPIWKESLIELGTLMFRQGEQMQVRILGTALENGNQLQPMLPDLERSYQQLLRSIASMEEGLRRFQGDARRYQLLYMTAKAYRMASYWPETLLQGNRLVSEEAISQWKNKRKELLIHSRDTFATLRREITTEEGKTWIPNSEILLCNSYFGEADLLFQEGNFKGALEAYRAAANRFINEPESLEAFVQMARCHEELGQLSDTRRTLEMAADILNRIPTDRDSRFLKNTRQSRQEWENQIRWMIQEIDRRNVN